MELPRVNSYTSRILLSHSTVIFLKSYKDKSMIHTISVNTLKSNVIYFIICNPPYDEKFLKIFIHQFIIFLS